MSYAYREWDKGAGGTWTWTPTANRDKGDALEDGVEGREELCGQQTRSLSKHKLQALIFLPYCILFLSLHTSPRDFAMAQWVRVRPIVPCPGLGMETTGALSSSQ